jgi:hypothetical protein
MRTNRDREKNAMRKRALKASLVALVIFGGGFAWQNVSSERTSLRAEQARLAALRMTPKKLAALEREAARDAAANAYAAKQQAEALARAITVDQVQAGVQQVASSTGG